VEVARGAGPDTGPLIRKRPSSAAAMSRKYLIDLAFCDFVAGVNYCIYTLLEKRGQAADCLLCILLDGIIPL